VGAILLDRDFSMLHWYNKMDHFTRILRNESGQSLVETAFVAPILVLLLVGAIDFGRFAYDGILVANGARAGVQYATQTGTTAENATAVQSAATTDVDSIALTATPTVSYECAKGTSTPTAVVCTEAQSAAGYHTITLVAVAVVPTTAFAPWIAYPGLPSSIPVSSTATMQASP
jgi:Flp pilus assembly protein TadG